MQEINDGAFIVQCELEIHPIAMIMPPMNPDEFESFKEDILGNGLHNPIILYQGKVLDGRNRYLACKELEIDIWARDWEGGSDPIEYVVSQNIHRRHLTPGQRAVAAAKAIDCHVEMARERQRAAGGDHGNQYTKKVALPEPVPEAVAPEEKNPIASNRSKNEARSKAGEMFNVSGRTVSDAKTILDYGTEEEKQAVESGISGVRPTAKQVRERENNKPKAKATFNSTNDSIEWAKWSWNPVTGCKHDCMYCYAKDIAIRFDGGFEPCFHPDRLDMPLNTKLPDRIDSGYRNVFVCSMADLFGDWVPQEWIDKVLDSCRKAPEWTFIFLTKNPKRLIGIEWPENAWVGTTVDCQFRVQGVINAFQELNSGNVIRPVVTFLSCEPMNERLSFGENGLQYFDWVIIGGRSKSTRMPAFQPEWEWVENLHFSARDAGCKIYWKPNLTVRPTEYPI